MRSNIERENVAANVVVDRLTAATGTALTGRKWDDGSEPAMHDFYIEGGGHRIGLEVTTIADGDRVGRDHRWGQLAPDGWVKVEGLAGCWIAYAQGETEASPVISAIQSCLPELETLGITRVDANFWQEHAFTPEALRPPGWDQARVLEHAGIVNACRVTDASEDLLRDHNGEVQVVRGFGFDRPADRDLPAAFVTQQLRGTHQCDVRKLIAVEDATARHIWMWVELVEGFTLIRSFDVEGLPGVDVDVEGIDGVWLGRSPGSSIVAGHVWLRGQGWSEFSAVRNSADLE